MELIQQMAFAKKMTERAAAVKDWRLSKKNKEMRDAARKLAEGKGYIVATDTEMMGKFNTRHTRARDNKKHLWCLYDSIPNARGMVEISAMCVR